MRVVLILLKSTAAAVRISSLFWSYSLRVCYTGTDQCTSVTSEECWLCSPFVICKFCDCRNGHFEECAVSLVFAFLVFIFVIIYVHVSVGLLFSCLKWICSLIISISYMSVSADIQWEGQVYWVISPHKFMFKIRKNVSGLRHFMFLDSSPYCQEVILKSCCNM